MEGMEQLIPIINELQEVFSCTKSKSSIELPQIVVVGDQSSGKSSVLESLVGKSFLPRGAGLVTRCPTILQMIHCDPKKKEHIFNSSTSTKTDPNNSKPLSGWSKLFKKPSDETDIDSLGDASQDEYEDVEWCEFHHKKGEKFTDFNLVRREIEEETVRKAGSNSNIVKDPIILTVYSPSVLTLTVVDLPGIVRVAKGDQPHDIEHQIRSLILEYITKEMSIILAVSAANNDFATSESLKLSQEVDPEGDRTLAVITKLDLMDRGTDAKDVLNGVDISVKLGIIGVVNRSQEDINNNKSVEDALQDEAKFLRENYPSMASKNGTPHLAKTLNKLLMLHIGKSLPALEEMIKDQHQIHTTTLERIGGKDLPADDNPFVVIELINRFVAAYRKAIDGSSKQLETKQLCGGAQIRQMCQAEINKKLDRMDKCNVTDQEIILAIQNSKGFESNLDSQDAFQGLTKDHIKTMKKPAVQCAEMILSELKKITRSCITQDIARFPKLQHEIIKVVNEMWTRKFREFKEDIEKYVDMQASYINTDHEDYVEAIDKLVNQKTEKQAPKLPKSSEFLGFGDCSLQNGFNFELQKQTPEQLMEYCERTKQQIKIYFKIFLKSLKNHFRISLAHHMIYYAKARLNSELMKQLYTPQFPEKIEELTKESEHIASEREEAVEMIEALERATEIIERTRAYITL